MDDERPLDDPARLADEARELVEKNAVTLQAQEIPLGVELAGGGLMPPRAGP